MRATTQKPAMWIEREATDILPSAVCWTELSASRRRPCILQNSGNFLQVHTTSASRKTVVDRYGVMFKALF